MISLNRRRGLGAVNLGNRVPTCTQSSRRPLFLMHVKRVDSVSTATIPFRSLRHSGDMSVPLTVVRRGAALGPPAWGGKGGAAGPAVVLLCARRSGPPVALTDENKIEFYACADRCSYLFAAQPGDGLAQQL